MYIISDSHIGHALCLTSLVTTHWKLVDGYQNLGGTRCLYFQGRIEDRWKLRWKEYFPQKLRYPPNRPQGAHCVVRANMRLTTVLSIMYL